MPTLLSFIPTRWSYPARAGIVIASEPSAFIQANGGRPARLSRPRKERETRNVTRCGSRELGHCAWPHTTQARARAHTQTHTHAHARGRESRWPRERRHLLHTRHSDFTGLFFGPPGPRR
jgi:hypothetical protein